MTLKHVCLTVTTHPTDRSLVTQSCFNVQALCIIWLCSRSVLYGCVGVLHYSCAAVMHFISCATPVYYRITQVINNHCRALIYWIIRTINIIVN